MSITKGRFTRRTIMRAAPAAALLPGVSAVAQAADYNIGALSSLTGPAAAFGKDYHDGFLAYVKDWNARGGFKGRKIVLSSLDDETNPVNAVNAFRRIASDAKTQVIWMALGSQTALGIKAIAKEFKVPVVSGGGVDELGRPPDPWFFKIAPGASDFVKGMIEWAKAKGVKTMATLNDAGAYGQSEQKAIKELTEKAGIKLVAAESFALADTNFNAQLVKIRNAKPEVFYNGATGNPAILIFKQYKQLGINIEMVVSLASVTGAFFQGIGGREAAEGILCIIPLGALAADVGGPIAEMHKAASAALGKPAILFHTLGWDTGTITEAALKDTDGSRQAVRDALEKLKDLPTINGPVTYTPTDHIGHDTRGLVLARYKAGKWVPEKK